MKITLQEFLNLRPQTVRISMISGRSDYFITCFLADKEKYFSLKDLDFTVDDLVTDLEKSRIKIERGEAMFFY